MTDIFDLHSRGKWTYTAEASTILQNTELAPLVTALGVAYTPGEVVKPQHNADYWAKATVGFDFTEADQVPTAKFNKILWKGLKGTKPYPQHQNGAELEKEQD